MSRWARILPFVALALFIAGCAWRREDFTVGQPAVCEVHHTPMTRTTVPIVYGLLIPTPLGEARYAASTNAFPNAETYVSGGCCIDVGSPHRAIIYICPECRKAADAWDKANDRKH